MNLTSDTERQQAIGFIKARLAILAERRASLLHRYVGPEGHVCAQMKVIELKTDRLLDTLNELEKQNRRFGGAATLDRSHPTSKG